MGHKLLSLSAQMEEYVALQNHMNPDSRRSQRLRRMEKLLRLAMKLELTDKQKTCIRLYYLEEKKVAEIADCLHIRPTTVYKHLKKARQALSRCVPYFDLSDPMLSNNAG